MIIAFDIDGVLAHQNTIDICTVKDKPEQEMIYYETLLPQVHPEFYASSEDEIIIITGRRDELKNITERWCKKWYPKYKLYITPTVTWKHESEWSDWFKRVAENKAKMINDLKVDVYFEDMPETVKALRKLCPNTKIIQFGGRLR